MLLLENPLSGTRTIDAVEGGETVAAFRERVGVPLACALVYAGKALSPNEAMPRIGRVTLTPRGCRAHTCSMDVMDLTAERGIGWRPCLHCNKQRCACVHDLRREVSDLKEEVSVLRAENAALRTENAALRAENAALRAELREERRLRKQDALRFEAERKAWKRERRELQSVINQLCIKLEASTRGGGWAAWNPFGACM